MNEGMVDWWQNEGMDGWMIDGLMVGLIEYVGILKSKMYVNKVSMGSCKIKPLPYNPT